MTRLLMLVEGPSERQFVSRVLVPHLEGNEVFCRPVTVTTRENPAGPNFTGGFVKYQKLIGELKRLLGDSNAHTTTLFDFYKMTGRDAGDTVEDMEKKLRADVFADTRFIPYVQKFEFEALLFSSPSIAAAELAEPDKAKDLQSILRDCGGAEEVDDGENTAPSKRLQSLFPDYVKVADGPMILETIGLKDIRQACPRFSQWVGKLEGLGT